MNDIEQRLTDHLRADADFADPHSRLDAVTSEVRSLQAARSQRGSWMRPAVAAAAVVAVTVGGLVVLSGRNASTPAPTASSPLLTINWSVEHATFAASAFSIDVASETFTTTGAAVDFTGFRADDRQQTLEVAWTENGVEMRWYVYFESDGVDWWVSEFDTYNGEAEGDWVRFAGEFFRTPLGTPYVGDVDLEVTDDGVTSRLRIENMVLEAFTANVILSDTPLADGNPPPLPPGIPAHGVAWTPEGTAALSAAELIVTQECMAEAGWEYEVADPAEWLSQSGAWSPHPFLGIRSVSAAEMFGYHLDTRQTLGPGTFAQTLPDDEQQAFFDALSGGDDAEFVDIPTPDGSDGGQVLAGGCVAETRDAFDGLTLVQEGYRRIVQETGIDQEEVANDSIRDERVQAALDEWSNCLDDAVGETGGTPNELAREFAFEDVTSPREIEVAIADATCQTEVGLVEIWDSVYAEYQRFALGDDADLFDTLALTRVDIVDRAIQVLEDRDLEAPRR